MLTNEQIKRLQVYKAFNKTKLINNTAWNNVIIRAFLWQIFSCIWTEFTIFSLLLGNTHRRRAHISAQGIIFTVLGEDIISIFLYNSLTCIFYTAQIKKHRALNVFGRCSLSCLQQLTGYLGLTLVFMWSSAQRENFNICFPRVFC